MEGGGARDKGAIERVRFYYFEKLTHLFYMYAIGAPNDFFTSE